ncbi:hypothetical protein BvRS1_31240 [Burkholderia vietnamiensis]|nr:hypothetical protein BvRS1_31240 [Burkholderia vietnamiensis]
MPPDLISFGGDWASYEELVYARYHADIVEGRPYLWGKRVAARFNPQTKGKGFSFWHVVSEGPVEDERTPDLHRCARIGWIAWVILSSDSCLHGFSWWISERTTKRGRKENLVLWAEEHDYVVVVEPKPDYVLLVSAYPVTERRANSLKHERDAFWQERALEPLW